MPGAIASVLSVLRLTRVSSAFAAVANVWFVILWTRVSPEEPESAALAGDPAWRLLAGGAANALGLFALGATLNDLLDEKRDRALKPDRPLASGRLGRDAAVVTVVLTLVAAVAGATVFGVPGVLLTLAVVAAIVAYNAAGKFIPAIGLALLSMIYAGQMMVPNARLAFAWPVVLVMAHALAVSGAAHVLSRKVPVLSRRALVAALAGWALAAVLLIEFARRSAGAPGPWPGWVPVPVVIGPVLLAALFAAFAWRKAVALGPGQRAAEKVQRYGALWMALYSCAWLAGVGALRETALLAGLALAGLIGMTVLREVYGLVDQPLGYRL